MPPQRTLTVGTNITAGLHEKTATGPDGTLIPYRMLWSPHRPHRKRGPPIGRPRHFKETRYSLYPFDAEPCPEPTPFARLHRPQVINEVSERCEEATPLLRVRCRTSYENAADSSWVGIPVWVSGLSVKWRRDMRRKRRSSQGPPTKAYRQRTSRRRNAARGVDGKQSTPACFADRPLAVSPLVWL